MENSSEKNNKVTPMSEMMERRAKEESSRFKRKGSGGHNCGSIASHFIRECLDANELGNDMLYADLHKKKFLYNKSSGKWLFRTGHHSATDIMENSIAGVEALALAYL